MTRDSRSFILKLLDKDMRRQVYSEWMTRQFPRDELKPLNSIEKCVRRDIYEAWGMWDGNELVAYAMLGFRNRGGMVLLDYYGVRPEFKNQGYGSIFLKRLREVYVGWKVIVIESENPDFIDDPAQRQTALRRLGFYQRNGCTDTGLRVNLFGVEFNVLALPVSAPVEDVEHLRHDYNEIYQGFLSKIFFLKFVRTRIENKEENK